MPDPQPSPSTPEPVDDAPAAEAPPRDAPLEDAPAAGADPTEAELLRTAVPATVRRAPRYGAFITAGMIVGLVVGLTLAVVLDRGSVTDAGGVLPFLGGSNGPRLLSALTGGALGVLVGAGLALWADRRSLRR